MTHGRSDRLATMNSRPAALDRKLGQRDTIKMNYDYSRKQPNTSASCSESRETQYNNGFNQAD